MYSASVVISAKNEAEHIGITVNSLISQTNIRDFEVIIVNDGSDDHTEQVLGKLKLPGVKSLKTKGVGTARARNLGARFARGSLLIFSDAHNLFPANWLEKIIEAEKQVQFDILAAGITADKKGWSPQDGTVTGYGQRLNEKAETKWIIERPENFSEVPVAAGGFTVFRPEVFKNIGGYEQGFFCWGYEDVEISVKAWLMGYTVKVLSDVVLEHFFRSRTPYSVNMTDYYYNYYRTAILHFNENRVSKMKAVLYEKLIQVSLNPDNSFKVMEGYLQDSRAYDLREHYFRTRKYNDDWFFDKFDIDF